jgi:hypothetical protein
MSATVPRRREMIAFGAGVTVLAGLMAIVILGGTYISAKKPPSELVASQITTLKAESPSR